VQDPAGLIRFVVGPGAELVPDLAGDLPGRGMWVSASRETLALALRRQAFARAARQPVKVPEDLIGRIEAQLARRAGQATAGFEKVREALAAGRVGVLLAASDGAVDGRAKLRRMAPGLPLIESLSSLELSLALGRENVIHAALAPGRLASRFLAEAARLAGFRRPPGSLEVAESESV
jgi:predicted RNA-binding protein YlxR (DUF448 family)